MPKRIDTFLEYTEPILHPIVAWTIVSPLVARLKIVPKAYLDVYVGLCTLIFVIYKLNEWFFHTPIQLDVKTDLVVITGAGSDEGLGHAMAKQFSNKGFQVAVLDLAMKWDPDTLPSPVHFMYCDISSTKSIELAYAQLSSQSCKPTVLINNAGIAHSKSVLELKESEIRQVYNVNLLGPILVCKQFLPSMLEREKGYIVNIASILGRIGVVRASAYCSSKAGLITFHDALMHEIPKDSGVSTLLVTPGHIATKMFSGIQEYMQFLAAPMETEEVADTIVKSVLKGQTGLLAMPFYARWEWLRLALPSFLWEYIRKISKIDQSLNDFSGPGIFYGKDQIQD